MKRKKERKKKERRKEGRSDRTEEQEEITLCVKTQSPSLNRQ
jgi:hypothetical protein